MMKLYDFTMPETNRAAKIRFLLGGAAVDVYIDNVRVTRASLSAA